MTSQRLRFDRRTRSRVAAPPRAGGSTDAGSDSAAAESVGEGRMEKLLAPLIERSQGKDASLQYTPLGQVRHGDRHYEVPSFVFRSPVGGTSLIRIGLFAAIHGDEPEGVMALRDLLLRLDERPDLAYGYELHVYPVCNPTGFEDGTRLSRTGRDLNREFWQESAEPEVLLLERELLSRQFAGLIALHSDDTVDGAYAFVRGATLTEALAKPALAAAASYVPVAGGESIDGFAAQEGLIAECYDGILCHPARLYPLPFEIIFETPQIFPVPQQAAAATAAVLAILHEYRQFIAHGQDL